MRVNVREKIVGDTYKVTWVSSGALPDLISSALLDKNEFVVSSIAAVSSGGGFYFALHQLPNTPGFYANEWRAQVGSRAYVTRQLVSVLDIQVD